MLEEKERVATLHTTRVKRSKLLARLHENHEQHRKEYEEAMRGFYDAMAHDIREMREKAIKQFTLAEKLVNDKAKAIPFAFGPYSTELRRPISHSDEFESAISRIEWELADEVDLSKGEFDSFVLNKWTWTKEHITMLTSFAPSSVGMSANY